MNQLGFALLRRMSMIPPPRTGTEPPKAQPRRGPCRPDATLGLWILMDPQYAASGSKLPLTATGFAVGACCLKHLTVCKETFMWYAYTLQSCMLGQCSRDCNRPCSTVVDVQVPFPAAVLDTGRSLVKQHRCPSTVLSDPRENPVESMHKQCKPAVLSHVCLDFLKLGFSFLTDQDSLVTLSVVLHSACKEAENSTSLVTQAAASTS